ncbi:MAG TPA: hypothetical protein VI670_10060 [Thermoanaerobaculia bacterium]|jgi:hypothetical protein
MPLITGRETDPLRRGALGCPGMRTSGAGVPGSSDAPPPIAARMMVSPEA